MALVLGWLYRSDANALRAITRADEQNVIQLASQVVAGKLEMLRGDTLYLAEITPLQRWLETGNPEELARLGADLLAFARHRGLYDQIRFLDERGRELVRINWNDGHPRSVPAAGLQDKSGRYYVEKTLSLQQGSVYTSPFDLNIEKDVVEQPIKPVLRLSTPVFDQAGRKRGLVILNYLGERLLDRLRAIRNRSGGGLWLLNAEGYWLLGPNPELEWGFMYPGRRAVRFDRDYGETWAAMLAGPERAQLMQNEGLFTYARIEPGASPIGPGTERLVLVAHVPAAILANMDKLIHDLVTTFIALGLLLTLVSAVITRKDIQRREVEGRIRESEGRFRGLLESAPDAIVIVDQGGRINLINSQTENWFGYDTDELLGQPVEQLVPARFRERHAAHRQGYFTEPLVRPMAAGIELFALRKDGTEFPVEISLSPLETDHGLLITGIIRDISARKRAENAQRQMQARYQELINNLPVGVYRNTADGGGRFLDINTAMLDIFEAQSAEEFLTHPMSALYCDAAVQKTVSDKIIRQGHINGEELRLKTLQGREFVAAITAAVKKDAAGNIYFDGIVEDISERKASEDHIRDLNHNLRARSTELEVINRELEAFSYSVSHDLRAPLRAIDGFSRIVVEEYTERLDEKGRDRLQRVRAAAQRMATLIDDLLNLSRVSRTEIKRGPVDMTSIANSVVEELRQSNPERNVRFEVQPDLVTQGDARLLHIVMDNLLGNAWKFTAQRAEARIEMGEGFDGNDAFFFVRDNGVGFDMAYADKLFGAFQRLHGAGEFPGTGVGLATVQRVIHKHGGRIWAESTLGVGATFYFTFEPGGSA